MRLSFGKIDIESDALSATPAPGGYTLTADSVRIVPPLGVVSYYHHGWQSWSLAAWGAPRPLPASQPVQLRPRQIDPLYALHPNPHGNWLGAVEDGAGNVLLLGSLGLDAHVQWRAGALHGWYETAQPGEWFLAYGPEAEVFAAYAAQLGQVFGKMRHATPLRVWCSWYSLYAEIDETRLERVFASLADLPFDVLQVDDGWQVNVGDWQANPKFPAGMNALADQIRATGRRAGLWLAPLLAVESSTLFQSHPDWFLKDETDHPHPFGPNWGEQTYALDTTHPAALDWLAGLMRQVRAWGFDYLKLDFLYAGALPGKRHLQMPREAAYRHGLAVMREAMGADVFFLACGAPILPSLGLCDALRVGPDVAAFWESRRDAVWLTNPATPGVKNAIRTTINRLWLAPLAQIDPDVAYFRTRYGSLNPAQRDLMIALAQVCNFRATSDLPAWLDSAELDALRRFLAESPQVERLSRARFALDGREVDFSPAMSIPAPARGAEKILAALAAWLANQPWVLALFDKIGAAAVRRSLKDKG